MNFEQYVAQVFENWGNSTNEHYRLGQCFYNTLAMNDKKRHLLQDVTGTDLDPYYDDDNIGVFMVHLVGHWND